MEAIQQGVIDINAIDEVLGINPAIGRRYGLRERELNSLLDNMSDVVETMLPPPRRDRAVNQRLLHDRAFAGRMLAYHWVALLRLKQSGRLR